MGSRHAVGAGGSILFLLTEGTHASALACRCLFIHHGSPLVGALPIRFHSGKLDLIRFVLIIAITVITEGAAHS